MNENNFFNGFFDNIQSNIAMIVKLRSQNTYYHYLAGLGGRSPLGTDVQRYSQYAGRTGDPLVIHWPKASKPTAKCAINITTALTFRPSPIAALFGIAAAIFIVPAMARF